MRIDKFICDNCGKEDKIQIKAITMSCGYGSIFDDMELDFCSDKCCVDFIIAKQKEVIEKGSYTMNLREKIEEEVNKCITELTR